MTVRRHLAKPLVSHSLDIQHHAALELLEAIRELFPEEFAELETIGEDLYIHFVVDEAEDPNSYPPGTLPERFQKRVWEWTTKHGIACDAVDFAAALMATGEDPLRGVWHIKNANGELVPMPPSLYANPANETLDEFLERAKGHYNEVQEFYLHHGFKKGPVKREHDHFRYLAAHLVGGLSWAQMADGDTAALVLPRKETTTIAEGAREAARLIGLRMPSKPGPRKGSRTRKAQHRVRRSRRR